MWDTDLAESLAQKKRIWEEGKEAFDNTYNIQCEPLRKNDIVLWYDKVITDINKSSQTKLQYWWLGLYRIHTINTVRSFKLEEMDRVVLNQSFIGSQLKPFIKKIQFFVPVPGHKAKDDSEARNNNDAGHSIQRGQEPSILWVTQSIQQARQIELEEREEGERQYTEGDQVPTIQTRNSISIVVRVPVLIDIQKAQYIYFDDLSDN
jgi:hypothetical protein